MKLKFIPCDHKTARLWVDALASSIDVSKSESAAIYANLCGYKSWDGLVSVIGIHAPSKVDEDINREEVLLRKDFYMNVLVGTHAISPYHAARIIDQLSPSSKRLPKKFAFESSSMHDAPSDDVISLFPPNFNFDDLNDGLVETMKELGVNLNSPPELGLIEPQEKIRLSGHVDPGAYYDFFNSMNWSVIEQSFVEDYKLGNRSFEISASTGNVPVYLTTLTQSPLDTQDDTAEKIKSLVLQDALSRESSPTIILMWGKFTNKEINGHSFSCPGCLYHSGVWREFLISTKMIGVQDVIDSTSKGIDFNNPDIELSDDGNDSLYLFLAITNGLDDLQELNNYRIQKAGSSSGWYVTMLIPKI